jgi:hypothetical protein
LIITDLDSIQEENQSKARPIRGRNLGTGNNTLKEWVPCKTKLDKLLNPSTEKITSNQKVRVAYPSPVQVNYLPDSEPQETIPYTFEDALVLNNLCLFKSFVDTKGLVKKMVDSLKKDTLDEACQEMFDSLEKASKAEMALDLLFTTEPKELNPPKYIEEGLGWLSSKLNKPFEESLTSK